MEHPSAFSHWGIYHERTRLAQTSPLLLEALPHVRSLNLALDLGDGGLGDVNALIEKGFGKITVVDPIISDVRTITPSQTTVEKVVEVFDEYNFLPDSADLITAQYALPFNPRATFSRMFANLKASLTTGGVFTGQLFGTHHEWNTHDTKRSFHSPTEIQDLLTGLAIVKCEESEFDQKSAMGVPSHWHVYDIIAIKE